MGQVTETFLDPLPFSGEKNQFGMSSVSGRWLVATNRAENSGQGAAYLYDCTFLPFPCIQKSRLVPDSPSQETFGFSVAMDFPLVVVGAPNYNGNTGRAVVFDCRAVLSCIQVDVLNTPDSPAGQSFGWSVSISGNLVAVGAPSSETRGKAHLFDCSNLPCQQVADILPISSIYRQFGWALSLSGTNLLVGASSTDFAGAASFLNCSSGSCVEYPLSVPLGSSFGSSVSLDGSLAAIGSPGTRQAYIYDCSSPPCTQEQVISSPYTAAFFGSAVALKGNLLAVGASRPPRTALYDCAFPSSCTRIEDLGPSNSDPRFGRWLSMDQSLLSATSSTSTNVPLNNFVNGTTLSFPLISFPFASSLTLFLLLPWLPCCLG